MRINSRLIFSKLSLLFILAVCSSGAFAQSQNEVQVSVLFDGTTGFLATDPAAPTGATPEPHTPGEDGSANNLVVRTHDQFAVRIDWNINEVDATNVILTTELPAIAEWTVDPTLGYAGCVVTTFTPPFTTVGGGSTGSQIVECELGDQLEGSNGTIRLTALLNESTDNTTFDVTSTLTNGDGSAPVSDGLDQLLTVSAIPIASYRKGVADVAGDPSTGPITSGGEDGILFLYPLSLIDFSQGPNPIIGAGPIGGGAIDFFDHAYRLTPSAALATQQQMDDAGFVGRTPCGPYDGAGAFPITPAAAWTCGAVTSPNGYPVVPINVAGLVANPAPALNADGTPNIVGSGVNVLTGQIAFWLPADEVQDEIDDPANDSALSARFENAIAAQDPSVVIADQADVLPIGVPDSSGGTVPELASTSDPGDDPSENTSRTVLGAAPPPSTSPGANLGHHIIFRGGPLQILETTTNSDEPRFGLDYRTVANGGLRGLLPGEQVNPATSNQDDIGDTPRGNVVTINSQVLTSSTVTTTLFDAPIQGCTAFDTTHYELTEFGDISVTQVNGFSNNPAVLGGSIVTSNTGPLAHVYTGTARALSPAQSGQGSSVGAPQAGLDYTVEFTNAPLELLPAGNFGVLNDELTCNDLDAGPAGWIDANDAAALTTAFDQNLDGNYEGITRARVRITQRFPWAQGPAGTDDTFNGFQAFFQARVKTDLMVQTVNQELFALQSHSYGDLDAGGVPDNVPFIGSTPDHCRPYNTTQWEASGNPRETTTGYCNNSFVDNGTGPLDDTDIVGWDNNSATRFNTAGNGVISFLNSSGAVIVIVEANLGLSKVNRDGLADIADNGDLVEFIITPRVVGSGLEALTNVRLTDALPANYTFDSFVSGPSSPGATCSEASDVITCQFSEPDPLIDTGALPSGLPGGWSDEIRILVEVTGAIADPDTPTVISNTATLRSDALGPWDPVGEDFTAPPTPGTKVSTSRASSFLPLPSDESVIAKSVNTLEGPCEFIPSGFTGTLAEWQARCSLIDLNDNMSFDLTIENEGNTALTDIAFVDVFPHDDDELEQASNTPNQGSSLPNTLGDGRSPESVFGAPAVANSISFVSLTASDLPANSQLTVFVTGDAPSTVSRDPDRAWAETALCDAVGGAVVNGVAGACPATNDDVTAVYALIDGANANFVGLLPNASTTLNIVLDSNNASCDDIWTNSFGVRSANMNLPVRSNDVSVMTRCVSLGSTAWQDSDGNGLQDAGEPAITDATVTLLNADGTPFDTDTSTPAIEPFVVLTDSEGQYNFNGLPAGDYRVQIDLATATNGNASVLIPTPAQVAGPNDDNNADSNIDLASDVNLADQIHTSGVVSLSIGGEPTTEADPIGTPGVDQPNQGLTLDAQPDENGNMTVDFGFIEPVSLGSVIWFDSNGDGQQTAGEPPIIGATVTLLNADGTVYDSDPTTVGIQALTVLSDANGFYNFNGLPEGDYRVQTDVTTVTSQTGLALSPSLGQVVDPNADESNSDSNIDAAAPGSNPAAGLYQSGVVSLSVGGEPVGELDIISGGPDQTNQTAGQPDANGNMTVDFGFFQPVSLGSTVWQDLNADGTQDAGELPIEGATVTLLDAAGVPVVGVLPVTTNANGEYNFNGLPPGDYRVQVDLSTVTGGEGLLPTPVQVADPDVAGDDNTDSNVDVAFDVITTDQIHTSGIVTLTVGGEPVAEQDPIGVTGPDQPNQDLTAISDPDDSGNMTVDFGFFVPVSIGSLVWQDANGDGIQDATEPLIAEGLVTLLDSNGLPATDINGDPIAPIDLADTGGTYFFDNLLPGDYQVQVSDLPAGFGPSPVQTVADDDNTPNDSNIAVADIANGVFTSGTFTLFPNSEPVGAAEESLIITAGDDADDANDANGNTTVDFGFIAALSVGSLVWEDLNGDGIQDANEPPIAGALITLLVDDGTGNFVPAVDINGALIAPLTTGPDGLYLFDNLPAGNYSIEVTPPSGLFPTGVNSTADDSVENDSNIVGETVPGSGVFQSPVFELSPFTEASESGAERGDTQDDALSDTLGDMTIDFGFIPPASIGNYVWLDLDMDGVQDANEDGIANVTVNLFADTDGDGVISGAELTTPVATAITGPNGEYLFPDLEPGVVYQTGVDTTTLPSGLEQTFDEGDGLGAADSLSAPIILAPNEFHDTADFGYAPPAGFGAVGDTIWVDANDDGVQDPGEPGIGGVTVTLTPGPGVDLGNGPGVPITTVTDANGKYLFPNLPLDATYVVEVDTSTLPAGYTNGPSNLGDPDVRDGNSSIADNQTIVVITAEDPINLDLDFGYLPPADQNNSIGDTIWIDVDQDGNGPAGAGDGSDTTEQGIAGVTVSLIDPATGEVIASTITDANGMYLFTGIPDGVYEVLVTDQNNVLAGLDQTVDSDDPANPGGFTATTPNSSTVDLDSAGASATPVADLDQDFGYVDSSTAGGDGSIGDTIFFDSDNSGTPDAGEGLEGVVVQLFGPGPDGVIGGGDDVLLASTTTDANGNYLFTGLDTSDTGPNPGTDYQVVVDTTTLPNGGSGWDNTVDPDNAADGVFNSESVTTLTAAAPVDLDQDFGYVGTDNNTITGTVWPDTDGDGNLVEVGAFAGVTIELTDQDGNVIATTVTDANGDYAFTGLPDGIYTVSVTDTDNVLNGFTHTDSPNGLTDTGDGTSKDDTGYTVDLDSAGLVDDPVTDVTGDFGYQPVITNPISLGSFVASLSGEGVVDINWTTQTEVANLGFKLYGQVEGEWQQLNASLILGLGDSVSTQRYQETIRTDATMFAIADIDLNGKETLHGPYQLGQEYGGVSDRKVIDWAAEKAERERKLEKREGLRKQQQQQRLDVRLKTANSSSSSNLSN